MSASPAAAAPTAEPVADGTPAIPFYVWLSALAVSSAVLGVQWDIAWHRSVGRDNFWSPPHMAIYLGGVLSGLAAAYLILTTTFGRTAAAVRARSSAVRIWGFAGPLGAFMWAWGGIAILASAPFDDWWHNTYGLDVKILSPPHSILALGIFAVQLGALILIVGIRNRASGRTRELLTWLFLYVGGFILVGLMTFEMELTRRVVQHTAAFYRAVAVVAPLVFLGVGRASGHRFGATITAAVYSAVLLLLLWILPLVPATPKLGPVYFQVTHLVPAGFPLLLIVPALGMDLAMQRLSSRSLWQQALLLGILFLVLFLLAQWPMANFLMSDSSHNWLFGSHYMSYNQQRSLSELRSLFVRSEASTWEFCLKFGGALGIAACSARLGLGCADFLRQLRR